MSSSRVVSSPTQTHTDTVWEPTTYRSLSTAPTGPVWPTTSVTVQCACLITKVGHSSAYLSTRTQMLQLSSRWNVCGLKHKNSKKCNFKQKQCCVFECDYWLIQSKDLGGYKKQKHHKDPFKSFFSAYKEQSCTQFKNGHKMSILLSSETICPGVCL